jgi:hypothetical protein
MIAFIDDHRATYGVEPICTVLPIAPSTYYAHAARRADPGRSPRPAIDLSTDGCAKLPSLVPYNQATMRHPPYAG